MSTPDISAALGRIEQKVDSLNERLFNDGSGVIPVLFLEQQATREKIAAVKEAQAVAKAEARKDAKWIASIGTFAGATIGALIHFLGGK